MIANGSCPAASSARRVCETWVSESRTLAAKRAWPSRSRFSASRPGIIRPTYRKSAGRVPREAKLEVALHVRPLGDEDAEHDRVARRAVASSLMVSNDSVLLRAERRNRALRRKVEVVGAETDHGTLERVERVLEEEQLAGGIHVRALPA